MARKFPVHLSMKCVINKSKLSLCDNAKFSDLTIKFGTEYFHAHKAILARTSEYFEKMLLGEFAV